jgi:hypothetical protein
MNAPQGSLSNGCESVSTTDPSHCGGCSACPSPANALAFCSNSLCSFNCDAGYLDCNGPSSTDGCEVNKLTDLANCGACGNACDTARANAAATCSNGQCVYTCNAGFSDCDNDLQAITSNGCETATAADITTCGGCGKTCADPARKNTTPSCAGGACSWACTPGFGDCDGVAANVSAFEENSFSYFWVFCSFPARLLPLPKQF